MELASPIRARRRAGFALAVSALVVTALAGAGNAARTLAADPMGPGGGACGGAGPTGPTISALAPVRLDGRLDMGAGPRVAIPTAIEAATPAALERQAVPYRVEPRRTDGRTMNAFDVPPEIPDDRDFERVETFDRLANPHYEIREEIWNTPEDLVMGAGIGRQGGLAYVPFWARNTIRLGRFSIFPFVHVEGVWHSNLGGTLANGKGAYEVTTSAGVLSEYLAEGGRTKFKASARADYRWYDDVLSDAWTYVGGVGFETRIKRFYTVDAGVEFERAQIPEDLDTSLASGENRIERTSVYADGRWDRFLTDDLKLEAGGAYAWIDDLSANARNGGDHTDLTLYGRLACAIMRHESFAYAEYRHEQRDAQGTSSDLDAAHEVRLGVNGILPHGRVRRLVGDAWVGYRTERYVASSAVGSLGRGRDTSVSLPTFGGDLTYRPSAYTSANLAFSHTNAFSAVSNYNLVDNVSMGVTQNLSHRLLARLAAAWSRIEPEGLGDSQRVTLGAGLRWVASDNLDVTTDYEFTHRFPGAGLVKGDGHRVAVGATLYVR